MMPHFSIGQPLKILDRYNIFDFMHSKHFCPTAVVSAFGEEDFMLIKSKILGLIVLIFAAGG